MRGLIAASAYGELQESERRALERHLASCAACRAQADAFAQLAARIPQTRPELGIDLVRTLRARLAGEEARRTAPGWRWAVASVAAAALVAGAYFLINGVPPVAPGTPGPVASEPPVAPVQRALDQAQSLLAAGNRTGAYDALSVAVAEHATDPRVGEVQLRLAELAFDSHWYDRADTAYEQLVVRYPDAVDSNPQRDAIRRRRDMLYEGRKDRYALLHELDRARRDPAGAFEIYENVVAQNPNTSAADQAVRELVALVGTDMPAGPQAVVTAMQSAREKLKNPVAVAKINLEIGMLAWRELDDLDLAQDALQQAAESSDVVLAQRARQSLEAVKQERRNPS